MRFRLQLALFLCLGVILATIQPSSAQETDELDIVFRGTDADDQISRLYVLDIDSEELEPILVSDFDESTTLLDVDVSPDGSWIALLTQHDDSIWFSRQAVLNDSDLSLDLSCTYTNVEVHILGDNNTVGVNTCDDFTLIDTSTDPPEMQSIYDGFSVRDWVGDDHYLDISRGGTAHICFQVPDELDDTHSNCQEVTTPLFDHLFSLGFTQDGTRVAYLGLISPDENQEAYIPVGIAEAEDDYVAVEGRIDEVFGAPQNIGRAGLIWHPDGVRFLYQFQARLSEGGTYGLVLYDTETGESELLISGLEFGVNAAVWSIDGDRLAILLPDDDERQIGGTLWIYGMTTGEFEDAGIDVDDMQWVN